METNSAYKSKKGGVYLPDVLSPTNDLVFKTLLTHPDALDVLRDIISAFTGIAVKTVEIRNTELPADDSLEKQIRLDVSCKTGSGEQINVEMQAAAMVGDSLKNKHKGFRNRSVLYTCKCYATQEGKSVD
jgi:predicted transposase/invertase (TIGR01784 family)